MLICSMLNKMTSNGMLGNYLELSIESRLDRNITKPTQGRAYVF